MHKFFIILSKREIAYIITGIIIICSLSTGIFKAAMAIKFQSDKPLSGKVIVIDPGHGGVDSGTRYGDKVLEKNLNLEISLKLKGLLIKKGANVIMTREIDDSLDDHIKNGSRHREDLNARVYLINKSNADLFVSIHVNYIRNSSTTFGPMVFYYRSSEISSQLANCIQQTLNTLSGYHKVGVKSKHSANPGNYVILRETSPPGVIIETGFLSNALDRTLLQKENHQNELALLITAGIIDYFYSEN